MVSHLFSTNKVLVLSLLTVRRTITIRSTKRHYPFGEALLADTNNSIKIIPYEMA